MYIENVGEEARRQEERKGKEERMREREREREKGKEIMRYTNIECERRTKVYVCVRAV